MITRDASETAGTSVLVPSMRHSSPSMRATQAGADGSRDSGSSNAAVTIERPSITSGNKRLFCSSVPNIATGSTPQTSAAHNGTGAAARPACSSNKHSSMIPPPLPPISSETPNPRRCARASSAHRSGSNAAPVFSSARSFSSVQYPIKICFARSRSEA